MLVDVRRPSAILAGLLLLQRGDGAEHHLVDEIAEFVKYTLVDLHPFMA